MICLYFLVIGILCMMVPHFILPMDLLSGGRGSQLLAECSFHYHSEAYLGLALIVAALVSCRTRKAIPALWLIAVLMVIQGIILRPVPYYLLTEENLVILGQTIALRSHTHIRDVIFLFAGAVFAGLILQFILARRTGQRRITFLTLPLANIRRKVFRSTALVMALAVVVGAFFSDVLLTRSIGNTLELGVGRLGADLVVVPAGHEEEAEKILLNGEPKVFSMPASVNDRIRRMSEVEKTSPQLFFRPFSYLVCCITETVLMVGYDPDTDFTIGPWVNYFLHKNQENSEIVVGARVKFYPGQKISLFGNLLSVVASLDETGIGYFDSTAFMPLDGARALIRAVKEQEQGRHLHKRKEMNDMSLTHLFDNEEIQKGELEKLDPEGISAVFVKVKPDVNVTKLAENIVATIPGVAVVNIKSATVSIKRQLTSMLDAFFLPILILLVMGTVILAAIFSMSANERRREVGLLRAMGATRMTIFKVFLTEALIIAALGGIFGVLSGTSLLLLFKNKIMASLNLLYIWPTPLTAAEVTLATLGVAVLVGIAAGLYPALKAARLEPYQAVRGK